MKLPAAQARGVDIARALTIPGWMESFELRWLAQVAAACRTIVEVGAWKGRSTRAMADHTTGTVYVVDNWCDATEGTDRRNEELATRGSTAIEADWHDNIREHEEAGRVILVRGHSPEMAPILQLITGGVDCVFIDADHSLEGCTADLHAYRAIVRGDGILAGHDYTTEVHPGVRQAVDRMFGPDVHQGPGSIWWVRP